MHPTLNVGWREEHEIRLQGQHKRKAGNCLPEGCVQSKCKNGCAMCAAAAECKSAGICRKKRSEIGVGT